MEELLVAQRVPVFGRGLGEELGDVGGGWKLLNDWDFLPDAEIGWTEECGDDAVDCIVIVAGHHGKVCLEGFDVAEGDGLVSDPGAQALTPASSFYKYY